mgnify:FL=1
MKVLFLGIFVLLTLAIGGFFYWQLQLVNPSLTTDVPPLFPQVSWEEFKESKGYKSLGEQGLYSQGDVYGSIRMNGQEWIASKKNLDRDSMRKLLVGFREYYDKELTELGWSTSYEDELYDFSPVAAGGPGGSIWGYVKVEDSKLREIVLQEITPIEDFGGMAACPCDVAFRVFVSEAVSLEELIKRVE